MMSDYITSVDEENTNVEVEVVPYSSSTALTLALSQHERQKSVKSDDNNNDKPLEIKNTTGAMAWSAVFENNMNEPLEEKDADCKDSTDYEVQRKSKSLMSFWRKNKKRGKKQFQELEDNEEIEGEVYETQTISSLWDNDRNDITTEILDPHARERKSLELDSLFSAALVHAKESEVKRKKQNQQRKSRNSTPQLIEEDAEIKDYDDLDTLFSEALAQAKKKEAGKLNEFKSHCARGGENDSNVKDHLRKESKEPFCRILNEDFECDLETVAFGDDENPSDSESSLNAILGRLTPKKSPRDYDYVFSELQTEMKQTNTGNEKGEDNLESTTTTKKQTQQLEKNSLLEEESETNSENMRGNLAKQQTDNINYFSTPVRQQTSFFSKMKTSFARGGNKESLEINSETSTACSTPSQEEVYFGDSLVFKLEPIKEKKRLRNFFGGKKNRRSIYKSRSVSFDGKSETSVNSTVKKPGNCTQNDDSINQNEIEGLVDTNLVTPTIIEEKKTGLEENEEDGNVQDYQGEATLKVTERKRNKSRRKKKKKGDNSEHFVDVKPEAIILDLMDMNDFSDDDRISDKYMNFEEHETMSSQRSVGLNPLSDQVSTISPPSIVRKNPDESSCFNGAGKKNLIMSESFDQYRKNVRDAAKWKIARQRYKSTLQSSLGIQDEVIMEDNICVGTMKEATEDLINDTCQAIKGAMISGDASLKSYKITRRTSSRSTKKISNATFDEDTEAMSSMMTGSSFMLPENSSNDDVHVNEDEDEDEDESNDDAVRKSSWGNIYSDDESDENCPEEKYLIPSD